MRSIVEMRPKLLWRLGLPPATVGVAVLAVTARSVMAALLALLWAALSVAAWRDYVRLDDGVIYERSPLGWRSPVVLGDVTQVRFRYQAGFKDLPHRELWLFQPRRMTIISLRWWSNWRPLVTTVVESVSEVRGAERYWDVDLDRGSRERLEALMVGDTRLPQPRPTQTEVG